MLRLSEAIALGRLLVTPIAGRVTDSRGGGCAIGMAGQAIGGFKGDEFGIISMQDAINEWPWLHTWIKGACSCPSWATVGTISQAIAHLFDAHVMQDKRYQDLSAKNEPWTMEQLIDWVRSVEPDEAPPSLPDAVATQVLDAEVCP